MRPVLPILLAACAPTVRAPATSGGPCLPRSPPLEAWIPVTSACLPEGQVPVRNAPSWLHHLQGEGCATVCDPQGCASLQGAFAIREEVEAAILGLSALGALPAGLCTDRSSRGMWGCAGRPPLPQGFALRVDVDRRGRPLRAELTGPFRTGIEGEALYAGLVRVDCHGQELWMVTSDPQELADRAR